jgi:hypothetical protein
MTMRKISLLCLTFSSVIAIAQNDSAAWYHPLHVGNEWLYKTSYSQTNFPNPPILSYYILHRSVVRDTLIDDVVWSVITEKEYGDNITRTSLERYDTLSSRFYIDSDIIDSVVCIQPGILFGSWKTVQKVYPDTLLSQPTISRHLKWLLTGLSREWVFSYGLGMTREDKDDGDFVSGSGSRSDIAYAKINGVEYGTKNILMADSLSQYHPLQTGNKWIYKVTSYNFPSTPSISYAVREVAGDTVIGNLQYKKIIGGDGVTASVERFDDITGNYMHHTGFRSIVEDSTAAHIMNTSFGIHASRKLNSVYSDSVLGASTLHREIVAANSVAENEMGWVYAYGLGRVKHYIKELSPSPYGIMDEDLVYAKINGIEYGTEPLGVDNESQWAPVEFSLYQNYPNPFNPATVIEFAVPAAASRDIVTLRIFDLLGREIRTFVNEPLPPGRHTVRFDATRLATGLYFYHIQSGAFADTKKMMYLK